MMFRSLALATALAAFASAADGNASLLRGDLERKLATERLLPKQTDGDTCSTIEFKGNGFPSGRTMFKFNVLGRDVDKGTSSGGFDPNGDRAILVPLELERKTQIKLLNGDVDQDCVNCGKQGSEGFCILDADATDGPAEICVLDPFESDQPCTEDAPATCDELATYAIFARTVGKGSATAGLCVDIDETVSCYVGSTDINPKKATDISQQLLTVCFDGVKIGLFDALCEDTYGNLGACGTGDFNTGTDESYFWEYDNNGNRRAEFRFYNAALLNEMTDSDCFGVTRGNAQCSS